MDMIEQTRKETEVFGVTYDRYVLLRLQELFTKKFGLGHIVEMPSHGAKAAGSLYSIGFGLAGCKVTLVNPEPETMYGWDEIGCSDRVETIKVKDITRTGLSEDAFDLAWNFVTWTELPDPAAYISEMKRISGKYVLFVTCNNFQPGYPWHRIIHRIYGFEWTHGNVAYNHVAAVKRLFRQNGLKITEYGAIDTPGWPDPSGPRDIRLHRDFNVPKKKPDWEVPILRYVKENRFPGWMRALGLWDMTFRKGIFKLPMSHLFYVLGEK